MGLIKNRLISNFMALANNHNTYIAQYLLTRSKCNQAMKIGQLIEYNIFFFKNHAENGLGRLVPDLVLFF